MVVTKDWIFMHNYKVVLFIFMMGLMVTPTMDSYATILDIEEILYPDIMGEIVDSTHVLPQKVDYLCSGDSANGIFDAKVAVNYVPPSSFIAIAAEEPFQFKVRSKMSDRRYGKGKMFAKMVGGVKQYHGRIFFTDYNVMEVYGHARGVRFELSCRRIFDVDYHNLGVESLDQSIGP